jgi:Domain of unknown function (DUF6456)
MNINSDPKPNITAFNESESPLYRLFCRKDARGKSTISEVQFAAGEKLRADYELDNFERRITASWDAAQTGSGGYASMSDNRIATLTDNSIDARRRVHRAFDAVGPELSGALYYICCLAGGLEQAERMLQLPQRSGKAVLGIALTGLARHYRLLKEPAKSNESKDFGHWAMAGYRPNLMPKRPDGHRT